MNQRLAELWRRIPIKGALDLNCGNQNRPAAANQTADKIIRDTFAKYRT
jgi:hypothetical protein